MKGNEIVKYYGYSDIGLKRRNNQDNYLIATNEVGDVFAFVCDGIGGGNSGDVASEIITHYFGLLFAKHKGFKSKEKAKEWLKEALVSANDYLFAKSTTDKSLEGMGTTFVGVLLSSKGNFVANIGDSRAYVMTTSDELEVVTIDHNLALELYHSGEITKEEYENHPKKNVLTNALGVVGSLKVDIFELALDTSQILLCSDGLHGYVSEENIHKVLLESKSIQGRVKELIDLANEAGGYDNTTVILIELEVS